MSEASDPVQQAATPPEVSPPEPYRPLSILALLGFVVAVLYALFIVAGGLMALFQREPWLLPAWLFGVPVGAALMAWLARTRIEDSEGTLGGLALTRWAMGLSLVCGLLYGAYYAATYFAVRQQARGLGDQFVELLKKGDTDRAFLLTLQPLERQSAEADPRTLLEVGYNAPGKTELGQFSSFKQADWVTLLLAGGEQTQIRPLGVNTWTYERGSYRVVLQYHVETPLAGYDLLVAVVGQESRTVRGRQWHIGREDTGMASESLRLSEEGVAFQGVSMGAMAFANAWLGQAEQGQMLTMYLQTLPVDERERLRRAGEIERFTDAAAVFGPAPFALQDASSEELSRGLEAFTRGSIVRADANTFWAHPRSREDIIRKVKAIFDPKQHMLYRARLLTRRIPTWVRSNGELIYLFTISLSLADSARGVPDYSVEANLRVAMPEDKISQTPPPWRILDLELVAGRSAVKTPPPQEREPGGRAE